MSWPWTVHPHACGEYGKCAICGTKMNGSSPRVWGIRQQHESENARARFIPTRVGNTHGTTAPLRAAAVHPHACGEYSLKLPCTSPPHGSSPRVWGILMHPITSKGTKRFIPTRVGNTAFPGMQIFTLPVHPHACGEYVRGNFCRWEISGSSPRVWGIRPATRLPCVPPRFIPTRVGNT